MVDELQGHNQFQDDNYSNLPNTLTQRVRKYNITRVFETVPWVFACCDVIASSIAGIPLKFYLPKKEKVPVDTSNLRVDYLVKNFNIPNATTLPPLIRQQYTNLKRLTNMNKLEEISTTHPLYALFNPPIKFEINSLSELIYITLLSLNLNGESFWTLEKVNGKLLNIRVESPYSMREIILNEKLIGWNYYKPGATKPTNSFTTGEVLQFKFPNPYNKYRGMSPLKAGRLSIEQWLNMSIWNAGRFKEGSVRPPLVIKYKHKISQKSEKEEIDRIGKMYSGFVRGQGPFIVDRDADVKSLFDNQELDFLKGQNLTREEICSTLHVPPAIAGIFEWASYANCVTKDTLITMENGSVKPIVEVKSGENVVTMGKSGVEINSVKNVWSAGYKDIYKIGLINRSIRCSEEHKFYKLMPGINPAHPRYESWANAKDLKVGDYVAVLTKLPEQTGNTTNSGFVVSDDLMEQLGLYVGDGSIMQSNGKIGGVGITIPDTDARKDFWIEQAKSVIGTKRHFKDKREVHISTDFYNYKIHSVAYADFLIENELAGNAHTKRVPSWIFELNPSLKESFILGVLEADGHYDKFGRFSLRLCNRQLVEDMQALCISIGYQVSKIHKSDRYSNFGRNIMFGFMISGSGSIAVSKFKNHHLPEGFSWARVTKIGLEEAEETFDIEINNTHNFVGNGVLVHNSAEQESFFWTICNMPKMILIKDILQVNLLDGYFPGVLVDWSWEYVEVLKENPIETGRKRLLEAQAVRIYTEANFSREDIAVILGNPMLATTTTLPQTVPQENSDEFNAPQQSGTTPEQQLQGTVNQGVDIISSKDLNIIIVKNGSNLLQVTKDFLYKYGDNYNKYVLDPFTELLAIKYGSFLENMAQHLIKNAKKGKFERLSSYDWQFIWEETSYPLIKRVFYLSLDKIHGEVVSPKSSLSDFMLTKGEGALANLSVSEMAYLEDIIRYLNSKAGFVGASLEELNAIMMTALLKNLTAVELAALLEQRVDFLYKSSAITIARTVTGTVYNNARYFGELFEGVIKHAWASALDPAVRDHHQQEHGSEVSVGERFPVTHLLYPQEPGGAPEEVISCRCTTWATEFALPEKRSIDKCAILKEIVTELNLVKEKDYVKRV